MQIKSLRTERVSVPQAVKDFKDCMRECVRYNMWHLVNGSLREVSVMYPCSQVWLENSVPYFDKGVTNEYGSERIEKRKLVEVK